LRVRDATWVVVDILACRPMSYVAAFRTYAWDDDIAGLAVRFFSACPGARHVVLVDETRGPIDIPGYEKVSHTTDTEALGLLDHPLGQSLWHNVDYGIYFLLLAFPDCDYYLLSESDLAVNLSLAPMMNDIAARRLDLVTRDVRLADPNWYWYANGSALYTKPWRSLLCFMVISHSAATTLLDSRRRLTNEFLAGELREWPFCEAFVPSTLKAIPSMKFADLEEFASVNNLNFRPRICLDDPRANAAGTLVHSVLGRNRFVATLLGEHRPNSYFQPGSELYNNLRSEPFEDVVPPLRAALLRQTDHAGLALLDQHMMELGLPVVVNEDLARCKPALTSSLNTWSRFQDRARDACGANGETLADDFGFHTSAEPEPWWMVDLLGEHVVDRISITNRVTESGRFRAFCIDSSRDSNVWITRYTKLTLEDISTDPEQPWMLLAADPFVARYVRIRLLGEGPLHLRRVQVFGRTIRPM